MAILITRSEGTLSTPNNWDTVVFGNLGTHTNLASNVTIPLLGTSTGGKRQLFTASKAGNITKVGLALFTNTNCNRNLTIRLQENLGTVTTPIASPGVVNLASHGLSNGDEVSFTTTGALPTGLVANVIYYVVNAGLDTFEVSLTVGGVSRNFSGTQSGVHTLYVTRESKTLTADEINCQKQFGRLADGHKYGGSYYHSFDGWSYPITTASNKWSLLYGTVGGTTGSYSVLFTNNESNICSFVAIDDPQTLSTTGDTIILAHKTEIDGSYTFAGVNGIGDASGAGTAVLILSNKASPDPNDVFFRYTNYTGPHTITLAGSIDYGSQAGVLFGVSEANPIPADKQLKITHITPTIGTLYHLFRPVKRTSTVTYTYDGMGYVQIYSEYPILGSTLSEPALTGQNVISVVGDVTVDRTDGKAWQIGDMLCIAGEGADVGNNITSYIGYTPIAISNMVFDGTNTTITLASNLTGTNRVGPNGNLIGGIVQNVTRGRYGCLIYDDRTVQGATCYWGYCDVLKLNGVMFDNVQGQTSGTGTPYYRSEYSVKTECKNVCMFNTTYLLGQSYHQWLVKSEGILLENVWAGKMSPCYNNIHYNYSYFKSGFTEIKNLYSIYRYNYYLFSLSSLQKLRIDGLYMQNARRVTAGMYIYGKKHEINNVQFFRVGSSTTSGNLQFGTMVGIKFIRNIYIDTSDIGVYIDSAGVFAGEIDNLVLNPRGLATCSSDLYEGLGIYGKLTFKNSNINTITDNMIDASDGTEISFENNNDAINNDYTFTPYGSIVRCGDGLTDTTTRLGGAGNYCVRMCPSSGEPDSRLERKFQQPTGDIQGKDLTIKCWVKISSSDYWAGTHQLPRLTVSYDGGTQEVYYQGSPTTERQPLYVSINPSTNATSVQVTISCASDAVGPNNCVYVDDGSCAYPSGVVLNLGKIDLWKDGMPLVPFISTNISASDVLEGLVTGTNVPGSVADYIKGLDVINDGVKKASILVPHNNDI